MPTGIAGQGKGCARPSQPRNEDPPKSLAMYPQGPHMPPHGDIAAAASMMMGVIATQLSFHLHPVNFFSFRPQADSAMIGKRFVSAAENITAGLSSNTVNHYRTCLYRVSTMFM